MPGDPRPRPLWQAHHALRALLYCGGLLLVGLSSPAQAQRPDPACIRAYEGQIKRVKALGPKAEATQDAVLGRAQRQLLQQLQKGHEQAKRGKDSSACFLLPALKSQAQALEEQFKVAGRPSGSPAPWPAPYQDPPPYVPFVATERVGNFIAECPGFIDITGACYQCPAGSKKNQSLGGLGGLRTGNELANFEGWGLDVAGNGGTPIGKVGVGADLYLDCPFCVDQPSGNVPPTFLGIGAGPNLGLGAAPADMGISAAFSKRLL